MSPIISESCCPEYSRSPSQRFDALRRNSRGVSTTRSKSTDATTGQRGAQVMSAQRSQVMPEELDEDKFGASLVSGLFSHCLEDYMLDEAGVDILREDAIEFESYVPCLQADEHALEDDESDGEEMCSMEYSDEDEVDAEVEAEVDLNVAVNFARNVVAQSMGMCDVEYAVSEAGSSEAEEEKESIDVLSDLPRGPGAHRVECYIVDDRALAALLSDDDLDSTNDEASDHEDELAFSDEAPGQECDAMVAQDLSWKAHRPPQAPCESGFEDESVLYSSSTAEQDDDEPFLAPPEHDVAWKAYDPTTGAVFDSFMLEQLEMSAQVVIPADANDLTTIDKTLEPLRTMVAEPFEELDYDDVRLLEELLDEPREETLDEPREEFLEELRLETPDVPKEDLDEMLLQQLLEEPEQEPIEPGPLELADMLAEAQCLLSGPTGYHEPILECKPQEVLVVTKQDTAQAEKTKTSSKASRGIKKSSSRTIIGGIVRKPANPTEEDFADASVEQHSKATPRNSQWLAGSLASGLRPQRRAVAKAQTFRLDETEETSTNTMRDSSLTRGYAALGVELYSLDRDDNVATQRCAPSTSDGSSRARSQFKSAMAMDLDLDSSNMESSQAAPSMLSSRSSSLGALRGENQRAKQTVTEPRVFSVSKSTSRLPVSNVPTVYDSKRKTRSHMDSFATWNQSVPADSKLFRLDRASAVSDF